MISNNWLCLLLTCVVFYATIACGTPPNEVVLDGYPIEYDSSELRGSFTNQPSWGGGNVITNLFVTWDSDYLYVALQGWSSDNNKLAVLIDVDPGNGTGATTTENWTSMDPGYIKYNDVGWTDATGGVDFGLDYMIASEGFYNNIIRVTYDGATLDTNETVALLDTGNGEAPTGGEVDMAVSQASSCGLSALEARIPWSELYNTNRFGEVGSGVVPTGATLRLYANLHNNAPDSSWSSEDSIPKQVSALSTYAAGQHETDDYIDVAIDADSNGIPDVATGDVNAPYIRDAVGGASQQVVYIYFNEMVETTSAETISNWTVSANTVTAANKISDSIVVLTLGSALPDSATSVSVTAENIEDAAMNTKSTKFCFNSITGGLTAGVTVRFVLETDSGMGKSHSPTAFHINGEFPLDWGYPPATTAPLTLESGTRYYRDVVYPPGSPAVIEYKYSSVLNGTNNYEAIRLVNFTTAARKLTLSQTGGTMIVTDYLGAAAGPLRDPTSNSNGYEELYGDTYRGDAGVRERIEVTFQLDLSDRELFNIDRVAILGSDPLRGFNFAPDGVGGIYDWGNSADMDWTIAGLEMYDDGTHGDLVSGDKIYSRLWSFTEDGTDDLLTEGSPYSLVGGKDDSLPLPTKPYEGTNWATARSPRSFKYRFYVIKDSGSSYVESPNSDIEVYIESSAGTNLVFDPYVWENDDLPYLQYSNPPVIVDIKVSNTTTIVSFTNNVDQKQHGYEICTDLVADNWADYGGAVLGSNGEWRVEYPANLDIAHFRVYAGSGPENKLTHWSPVLLSETGGILHVEFSPYGRPATEGSLNVAMWVNVDTNGSIITAGDWVDHPMTFDSSEGLWKIDLNVTSNANAVVKFLFKDMDDGGEDVDYGWGGIDTYNIHIGGPADWTPKNANTGEVVTITFDATGGRLEDNTNVWLHMGFDKFEGTDWHSTISTAMNLVATNKWDIDITIPTNASKTVHFLFNEGGTSNWYNAGGSDWMFFIQE